jgi:hypothetical protein
MNAETIDKAVDGRTARDGWMARCLAHVAEVAGRVLVIECFRVTIYTWLVLTARHWPPGAVIEPCRGVAAGASNGRLWQCRRILWTWPRRQRQRMNWTPG